jgi:zinc protease
LKSFTLDDVKNFYGKNLGARRTHVYVAGKFDQAAARKAIEGAFGKWVSGPEPTKNPVKPARTFSFHLVERPGSEQSVINLGLPIIDPSHADYNRVRVMNTLLGGFFSSRITSNIREQKGYTYSPFSTVSPRYRDAHWMQVADVTTKVTGPSLKEIYYEIDRLSKEAPTAAEMDLVHNWMAGNFIIQNSARNGILAQLSFVDLHGLGDDYLRNFVQNITAITADEVRETAAKYLNKSQMTVVVVGDKSQIAEQVAAYQKPQP